MKAKQKFQFSVVWLSSVIWLLAGCAQPTAGLGPTAEADHTSAILFGRFSLGHEYSFDNHLALWLQNLDSRNSVFIYFDPAHPVYGIKVKPGRYQIAGCVGVNRMREIRGRLPFRPSRLTAPFTATAGAQIYLGDFSGVAAFDGMMYE